MPEIIIDLNINSSDALRYYKGQAQYINCVSISGQVVRLPASLIRDLITCNGIKGKFLVKYLNNGKLKSIKPL